MPEQLFLPTTSIREVALPVPEKERGFDFDIQPYLTEPVIRRLENYVAMEIRARQPIELLPILAQVKQVSPEILRNAGIAWSQLQAVAHNHMTRSLRTAGMRTDVYTLPGLQALASEVESFKWLFPGVLDVHDLNNANATLQELVQRYFGMNDFHAGVKALRYVRTIIPSHFHEIADISRYEGQLFQDADECITDLIDAPEFVKLYGLEVLVDSGVAFPSVKQHIASSELLRSELGQLFQQSPMVHAADSTNKDQIASFLQLAVATKFLSHQLIVSDQEIAFGEPVLGRNDLGDDMSHIPDQRKY